ncbi:MAG: stage V sporulation protein E [Bacillota bacterium]
MRQRKHAPDFVLLVTVMLLLAVGLVMVYSASEFVSRHSTKTVADPDGYSYFFARRQLSWVLIGLVALLLGMRINYWNLAKLSKLAFIVSIILLLLVLIPGIGVERNGSRRWLGIGDQVLQPSEIAKISLAFFLAKMMADKGKSMQSFHKGLLPCLLLTGLVCGLVVAEPDLGTAIAIFAVAAVMIFVAGAKWSHIIALGVLALAAVGLLVFTSDYRIDRLSFLNPWSDPTGDGFQLIQSFYALGPGGLFGRGLAQSIQKQFYLPEPHTDFILAIIGEELGFFGTSLVVLLFGVFIWRGFRIAMSAPDAFASLLAVGMTTMVGLQAIINIAVVTGSIPTTGITLPLISYGGSSLLFTMASIGVLLNVSKYVRE